MPIASYILHFEHLTLDQRSIFGIEFICNIKQLLRSDAHQAFDASIIGAMNFRGDN